MIVKTDVDIYFNSIQRKFLLVYKKWKGRDNANVSTGVKYGVPSSPFGLRLCIPKWASQILEGPWKPLPNFGFLSKINILNGYFQTSLHLPNTPKASPWIPIKLDRYLMHPYIPIMIGWTIVIRCIRNSSVKKATHPSTTMVFEGLTLEFP